jgi:hypothetical protein
MKNKLPFLRYKSIASNPRRFKEIADLTRTKIS